MKFEVRRLILDSAFRWCSSRSDLSRSKDINMFCVVFLFVCLSVLHGSDKAQDFGPISCPPSQSMGKHDLSAMESVLERWERHWRPSKGFQVRTGGFWVLILMVGAASQAYPWNGDRNVDSIGIIGILWWSNSLLWKINDNHQSYYIYRCINHYRSWN